MLITKTSVQTNKMEKKKYKNIVEQEYARSRKRKS